MIVPHLLTESKNKSKKQTCSSRTLMSEKRIAFSSYNRKKNTLVDVLDCRRPSHSPLTPYYVK